MNKKLSFTEAHEKNSFPLKIVQCELILLLFLDIILYYYLKLDFFIQASFLCIHFHMIHLHIKDTRDLEI